jgi:hypothetical protein
MAAVLRSKGLELVMQDTDDVRITRCRLGNNPTRSQAMKAVRTSDQSQKSTNQFQLNSNC